jgi:hypothetical protein
MSDGNGFTCVHVDCDAYKLKGLRLGPVASFMLWDPSWPIGECEDDMLELKLLASLAARRHVVHVCAIDKFFGARIRSRARFALLDLRRTSCNRAGSTHKVIAKVVHQTQVSGMNGIGDDNFVTTHVARDARRGTHVSNDIERAGSTVALLVADAWHISSMRYKSTLLESLRVESAGVSDLMNGIVKCWGAGQGRSYRSYQDDESTIAREVFDFAATAYLAFVNDPEQFGWKKGSAEHAAAVKALRRPLQKAFEAEADQTLGGVLEHESRIDILLHECSAALKVRQHRNRHEAHGHTLPLHYSDPKYRRLMRDLYERAVDARLPIMGGFVSLARASVSHVDDELSLRGTSCCATQV